MISNLYMNNQKIKAKSDSLFKKTLWEGKNNTKRLCTEKQKIREVESLGDL